MRTAILLAGHTRTYRHCLESFWKAFGHLTPDIFIHTWDKTGASDKLWWANDGEPNSTRTDEGELVVDYDPRVIQIVPEMKRTEGNEEHQAQQRMKSQWWSPLMALVTVPKLNTYDLVIKTRFDLMYENKFDPREPYGVWPAERTYFVPYPISMLRNVHSDTFVAGTPEFMTQYLQYYHHIKRYMDRSVVTMGVPGWCSEYGATAFMRDHNYWGITPTLTTLKASILRESGDRINLFTR